MKKIPQDAVHGLEDAIEIGARIHQELIESHMDHLDPPTEIDHYIIICTYCGTQTEGPCCDENHHIEIPVDKDGNEIT